MRKFMAVLVLAGLSVGSGCASVVMAVVDPKKPYGGVQADAEIVSYSAKHGSAVGFVIGGLDMVPSLAMDTVLLPVTLTSAAAHQVGQRQF